MNALRQIIQTTTSSITIQIPQEFQNQSLEVIVLPIDSSQPPPLSKRPYGLAKGEFVVTEQFFEVLPDELQQAFEGV